jgi:hypothetical protein
LRTHARRRVSLDAGDLLVAAAGIVGDDEASRVVAESFPEIRAHHAKAASDEMIAALERPILEQIPESAPANIAYGIPVVRAQPKVGRNDPCPCGSGKKFKKCCEGKATPDSADPDAARKKQLEAVAKTLSKAQVNELRAQDLVTLKIEELAPPVQIAVFQRLCDFRKWDDAERVREVIAKTRKDGKTDDLRLEIVICAFRARARDVAKEHAAKLAEAGVEHPLVDVMREVASPSRWTLTRLEKIAASGLREDPEALFDLSDALLSDHPALGILFARAALTPTRPHDSYEFLELIEEARDRLGLPPNDLAGDIYDAMEALWGQREDRAEDEPDAKVVELTKERESLRSRVRDAGDRIAELERSLREQQKMLEEERPSSRAALENAQPDVERRKLRDQISELKSLIAEGNQERADLRKKLAERTTGAPRAPQIVPPAQPSEPEEIDRGERSLDEPPRVRGVIMPRLSRATEASLRDLPSRVVRDTLRLVADLCGGEASAWREVKQLERVNPAMYSARVGIHYRLLFRVEPGVLDIADIIPRQGLDAAIRRFT